VENYGTVVQATADNIIRRMRLACSIIIVTDSHTPYAMFIAVGYMRAPQWNNKPTLPLWLKIQEFITNSIRPKIHAATLTFRFPQRYKQPSLYSVI
jgi:hypothetical protein